MSRSSSCREEFRGRSDELGIDIDRTGHLLAIVRAQRQRLEEMEVDCERATARILHDSPSTNHQTAEISSRPTSTFGRSKPSWQEGQDIEHPQLKAGEEELLINQSLEGASDEAHYGEDHKLLELKEDITMWQTTATTNQALGYEEADQWLLSKFFQNTFRILSTSFGGRGNSSLSGAWGAVDRLIEDFLAILGCEAKPGQLKKSFNILLQHKR